MNGLGSSDYGMAQNNVTINDIFLSDRYFSVNLEHMFVFTIGPHLYHVGYTFDLRTGEIITLPELLGLSLNETKELVLSKVKEFSGNNYEADLAEPAVQSSSAEDFRFCIKEDGTVYLLFSRDQYMSGPMSFGEIMLDMQIDSGNKIYGYKR